MGAAQGFTPPPDELRLYWMSQRFSALPEDGGLYEQDAGLLTRMSVLDNVYRAVVRLRNMQGAQIHQLTVQERKMLAWLRDEGMI